MYDVAASLLAGGIAFSELCGAQTAVFASKGELRRTVQGGGVSLNKERVADPEMMVTADHLLNGRYLLIQKGKKNYSLIRVT